ncbi:MAG TPA: transglutaminase-like domain-containing protein [Sedimentisphaerales bacterium]|nr:transglutaminase-like domain-containing protein [Sedimentisphaerales bacterium]
MKSQRIIAGAMIMGGSFLVAVTSGDITFPAILCVLGIVGLEGHFTVGIRPEKRYITALLLLLLAVLFAVHCKLATPPTDQLAAFAWETIARYFLSCMVLILFLRSRREPLSADAAIRASERAMTPLPANLALFHMATVMACGQIWLLDDRYILFRLMELVGVGMVVLYAWGATWGFHGTEFPTPGKPRQSLGFHILCAILAVVMINLGWVGGSVLYSRVESLNLLPTWLWRANVPLDTSAAGVSQIGFSASGKLSGVLAIMEDTNSEVVLRITSSASPGYLRAMAFITYRPSEWKEGSNRSHLYQDESRLFGRMGLFRLNNREANREMTVRHESAVIDVLFLPLGACSIEAPFTTLERDDDNGTLRSRETRANLTYHIDYSTSLSLDPPSPDKIRRMTNVQHVDPRFRPLANRIFRNCRTTAEKIEAVTRYFHTNYTYSLGLAVPPDQDPVTYFLLEASTGYCEYFATGAALLLRFADVPTRYVTGFLVTERDTDGKSWIARNMDAHAWVEAWDRERNTWVIVEATSQEDLANYSRDDAWLANQSGRSVLVTRLIQAVYDYGLLGLIGWFFKVYSLRMAVAMFLAFLGAAVGLALMRRRRRVRRKAVRRATLTPELQTLHKLLATVDRRARSVGVHRGTHETLHAFAARIRPMATESDGEIKDLADWYLAYAGLRYGRTISPERIVELQRFFQKPQKAF